MNQQQQQHHHHDDAEESDQIANCARVWPIKMREKFFRHHAGGVVRLNHGSFGACPQPVMDATAEARAQWYQQPDAFYFEQLESQILENRKAVAEVVNCDVRDLALVDNATTGSLVVAHLVAKDLQRRLLSDPVHYVKPKILLSNFVYGAVKNVFIEHLGDLAEIEYINFPFPLQSRAHALEALQQALLSSSSSSTTTTTTTTTTNTNGSPLSSNGSPYSLGSSGETPQVPSMGDGEWETHTPSNFVPSSPFNPFQNQNQSPFSSSDGFTVPSPNLFDHSPSPSFTAVSPSPSFISSPSPLQQQTFFPTSHFQQQQQHFHFQQQQVQQVVQQQQVQKRQPIRLVVLDHISSIPAIIFPVQEMVKLCYSCGVEEVFIDGAHAIGQTPIDLMAIGADYYTSNLHKWLFCASGVALFFCHPRKRGNQSPPLMADELGSEPIDFASSNNFGQPHHPLTSHNYHRGMGAEFAWTGTHDYSPFLSVRNAIHFINSTLGGVDNLLSYNHHVVYSAASVVAKAWGTSFGTGEEELVGSMINIRLPDALCAQIHSSADALKLRSLIRDYFRVECVPFYWREGESYIRLSAQIYNSFNDYEILRDSVLASIKLLSSMSQ